MPIGKVFSSFAEAVADIPDGSVIMIGGFGCPSGNPENLVMALRDQGARNLTIIGNGPFISEGFGSVTGLNYTDCTILLEKKQVRKVVASFPIWSLGGTTGPLQSQIEAGEVELEAVPQGTLAARIWAGGAGIGGFYTPTGVGTVFEEGKERKIIEGKEYVLELPLKADYAFVKACKADTMGNLIYRLAARSFNPVVAPAARITIAEVDEIVEPGELAPEVIVTSGVYVDRIVQIPKEGQK